MTNYRILIQFARGVWLLSLYAVHVIRLLLVLWCVESTLIRGVMVMLVVKAAMATNHGVRSGVDVTDRRWQFDRAPRMRSEVFHALQILRGKRSDEIHGVILVAVVGTQCIVAVRRVVQQG